MKKILSGILIIFLLQGIFILLPERIQAQTQEKLTNQSVIELVKAGLSDEIIAAKINSSATDFDSSVTALQELKNNHVSDRLLVLMVGGGDALAIKPLREVEIAIPDGMPIEVVLRNDLSGQYVKVGEVVNFTVARDIQIDGVTVIEKDAPATGKITKAKRAGYWGKMGKLEWTIQDVLTAGGARIPVRFTKKLDGESRGGTVAVATVSTALLFLPIAPIGLLWGLKKGEPASIQSGNYYTIYADGTAKIKVKTR